MIISEYVNVKITKRNIEYYNSKKYKCSLKDIIQVSTYDVSSGSHKKIDVKCEKCGIINNVKIQDYWKCYYKHNYNYYSCFKCKINKTKNTCISKYGTEFPLQNSEIIEKMKKTIFNKWGVYNISQSQLVKDSKIQTSMLRYGHKSPTQSEEVKLKTKETCIDKYGCENVAQNIIIKEKMKNTFLLKYGCENPWQNEGVKEKIRLSNISNGIWSNDITEFIKYRNQITHQTKKIKDELFSQWQGYDFYDNEYIKTNLNKPSHDIDYPTIDHKTSVLYGYLNDIPAEEISDIKNLCITKRCINSKKGSKCHSEFIEKFNL